MKSGVKKMMEADVQGHCLIMSVAVNKRMLWPSRQIKDEIEAVHRHHDECEGKFQVRMSCQREIGAGVISLQRRKQW